MKNKSEEKAPDSGKKGKIPAGRGVKTNPNLHIPKKVAGGATGTMVGALVAGPIGAVVGGMVGTLIGAAAAKDGGPAKRSIKDPQSSGSRPRSIAAQREPKAAHSAGTAKKRTAHSKKRRARASPYQLKERS